MKIDRREFAMMLLAGMPLAAMGVTREDVERIWLGRNACQRAT